MKSSVLMDSDELPVRASSTTELNSAYISQDVFVSALWIHYIDLAPVALST